MRRLTLSLLALAVRALVARGGAGTARAKGCKSATYPGEGYFNDLTVKGTSCPAGRQVQKSHYKCRVRNGGRDGRCKSRVEGYSCKERRGARSSVEYNAIVTCTRGSKRVRWQYQQNL